MFRLVPRLRIQRQVSVRAARQQASRHASVGHDKDNKSNHHKARSTILRRPVHSTAIRMALAPKFAGHKLAFGVRRSDAVGVPPAVHTLEVYLDYVCPFSAKQFNTLYHVVAPIIRERPEWAGRVEIIFRQQVQPWHPSSTLVHEAGLAVLRLAPGKFWAWSDALFAAQKDFFDVAVVNETRNQTYKRLARLAAANVGIDEAGLYRLLHVDDKPADDGSLNIGNAVTNDLKLLIKTGRLVGVHVSPTVIFDGVVANDISSSWTKEQWLEWLGKNIA